MKKRILNLLEEAKEIHSKAIAERNRNFNNYDLTNAGQEKVIKNITDKIMPQIQEKLNAGLLLFDKKIAEIKEKETAAISKKFKSLEYQKMLNEKCKVLKELDLTRTDTTFLKEYLSEFKDDPIALEMLNNILHTSNDELFFASTILPPNTVGTLERKLTRYKNEFKSVMELLSDITGMGMNAANDAIIHNYALTIYCENDNLDADDTLVAERMDAEGGAKMVLSFKRLR